VQLLVTISHWTVAVNLEHPKKKSTIHNHSGKMAALPNLLNDNLSRDFTSKIQPGS